MTVQDLPEEPSYTYAQALSHSPICTLLTLSGSQVKTIKAPQLYTFCFFFHPQKTVAVPELLSSATIPSSERYRAPCLLCSQAEGKKPVAPAIMIPDHSQTKIPTHHRYMSFSSPVECTMWTS